MVKKIIIALSIILLLATGLIFFLTKQGLLFQTNEEPGELVDASQPTPTPTPIIVDLDDQSVLTTKDSKLQIIHPASWLVEEQQTQNDPDTIQSINLVSPDGDIGLDISITQQYNSELKQVIDCENNLSITCETIINNTRPVVLAKSNGNNPSTIGVYAIFARKIFRINFSIQNNANQTQNIETVNKIIATLKFF